MALSMQSAPLGGRLLLSIDLELDFPQRGRADLNRMDAATTALLSLCERCELAATWAVSDPALSAATDLIRAASGRNEVAVLGDQTWVGPGAGRQRFSRELARRFDSARAAGIDATTLVLRNAPLGEHVDLLPRRGVTAVRPPIRGIGMTEQARAFDLVHYGVWGFAPTVVVPGIVRWWPGSGGEMAAYDQLNMAVEHRSFVHLTIDGPRIVEQGLAGLGLVERVLDYAAELCAMGQLIPMTLGELAGRLLERREVQPQRSILHAA